MWSPQTRQLINAAYDEDLATAGDLTSSLLGESAIPVTADVAVRSPGVVSGLSLAPLICETFAARLNANLTFESVRTDGDTVHVGDVVGRITGPKPAVLATERTLLNFLCRMSGVATMTRRYLDAAKSTNPHVHVLDTRKTIPGWRELDKYAVRSAGGTNHRTGLYDAILIKDNHLAGIATPDLPAYLTNLLAKRTPAATFVEIEVDNLDQFYEVCKVTAVDIILLDNFTLDDMHSAVAHRNANHTTGTPKLEASGGVTLDTIADIAATGVDRISIGALTHSAPNLDLALDLPD